MSSLPNKDTEITEQLREILKCNCGGNNYLNGRHYDDCATTAIPAIQNLINSEANRRVQEFAQKLKDYSYYVGHEQTLVVSHKDIDETLDELNPIRRYRGMTPSDQYRRLARKILEHPAITIDFASGEKQHSVEYDLAALTAAAEELVIAELEDVWHHQKQIEATPLSSWLIARVAALRQSQRKQVEEDK